MFSNDWIPIGYFGLGINISNFLRLQIYELYSMKKIAIVGCKPVRGGEANFLNQIYEIYSMKKIATVGFQNIMYYLFS